MTRLRIFATLLIVYCSQRDEDAAQAVCAKLTEAVRVRTDNLKGRWWPETLTLGEADLALPTEGRYSGLMWQILQQGNDGTRFASMFMRTPTPYKMTVPSCCIACSIPAQPGRNPECC